MIQILIILKLMILSKNINKTFKKIKKFKRYYKELKMKKNWESVKIL